MRYVARIIRALLIGALFVWLSLPYSTYADNNHSNILKNVRILATDESLQYLADHQDTSGGIIEESDSVPSDGITAWTVIAFASAGYDPATVKQSGGQSLIDYIKSRSCTYSTTTDIERTVLAVSAAGLNASNFGGCDLLAKIDTLTNINTGVIGDGLVSSVFGVLAVRSQEKLINQSTIDYIVNSQADDGGWSSGWGEEANITAQTIMALVSSGYDKSAAAITKAKQYLKNLQTDSGGIKYDTNAWTTTPDAFSDAYTLQAIAALGESPIDTYWLASDKSILDDIATLKKADGAYRFSLDPDYGDLTPVWTTAMIIPALEGKPLGWRGVDLKPYSTITSPEKPADKNQATPSPISSSPVEQNSDMPSSASIALTDTADSLSFTPIKTLTDYTHTSSDDKTQEAIASQLSTKPEILGATDSQPAPSNNTTVILLLLSCAGLILGAGISILLGRFNLVLPVIIVVVMTIPVATFASRAGVVVRHGNGTTNQKCVEFAESSISGYSLLQRGGFNPILDRGFIVSINGDKAKSFSDLGSQNDYWSYWQMRDSGWIYSRAGATSSKVYDGSVDGWQHGGSELLLAPIKFDDICPLADIAANISDQPPTATASSNNNPPAAPVISDNSPSNSQPADKTVEQSSQTTVNNNANNKEIASIKGANKTNISESNSDQPKKIAYLIPVLAASIAVGFLAHRMTYKIRKKRRGSR